MINGNKTQNSETELLLNKPKINRRLDRETICSRLLPISPISRIENPNTQHTVSDGVRDNG